MSEDCALAEALREAAAAGVSPASLAALHRAVQPEAGSGIDVDTLDEAVNAVAERFGWVPQDASGWGIGEGEYTKALAAAYAAAAQSGEGSE